MKSTDSPELLRPYIFHGLELEQGADNATGECPFCDKPKKFSVKIETGQFRCLFCEETGNIYSFLHRLLQQSKERTTTKDYAALAKHRGCSIESLQYFGLAKSCITGEWLIPAYNLEGNLANLYRVVERKDEHGKTRLAPMSTPGCKPWPFSTHHLVQTPKDNIWITEGVWDGCALYDQLTTHRQQGDKLIKTSNPEQAMFATHNILAVPGCGNFNADWLAVCADKTVRVCFDNDYPKKYGPDHPKAGQLIMQKGKEVRPGWDGMERIVKQVGLAKQRPSKLFCLFWNGDNEGHNPKLKDGYDLGDLFKEPKLAGVGGNPLQWLLDHLQQVKISSPRKSAKEEKVVPSIEPIECTSFDELCEHWSSVLHFTQQLRDTLAIMLSVVLSTESEKVNHLWLRVIGPPGSGKSTLAEAISVAREWVSPKSIITGFHSGFVDPNADEPQTASLIPELDNKTVIMKDGDTLANSPGRDKILSELRDLYDGTSRAHYRNMKADEFEDVRLSFILCGTDELRQLNRSFLGERFIDCEIMARGEDTSPYLQRASDNTYASLANFLSPEKADDGEEKIPVDRMLKLKQVTYGFLKYLKENYKTFPVPKITPEVHSRLQAMGEYVALMRARVRHDHNDSSFRPRTELPTRLTSIFTKLAFFNALVLGKRELCEEVLRVTLKVVHDTSIGTQQELTEALAADRQDLGTAVRGMTLSLNLPETSVRRVLGDMRQFNIAQPYTAANNSGQRGRDRHLWVLTPNMRQLWNKIHHITQGKSANGVSTNGKRVEATKGSNNRNPKLRKTQPPTNTRRAPTPKRSPSRT